MVTVGLANFMTNSFTLTFSAQRVLKESDLIIIERGEADDENRRYRQIFHGNP